MASKAGEWEPELHIVILVNGIQDLLRAWQSTIDKRRTGCLCSVRSLGSIENPGTFLSDAVSVCIKVNFTRYIYSYPFLHSSLHTHSKFIVEWQCYSGYMVIDFDWHAIICVFDLIICCTLCNVL